MNRIKPKHLIIAACVIIALLLCCGAVSCVTNAGPSVGSVDFDHDSKKKKKKSPKKKKKSTKKKRSMEAYNTVLAGHFHTSNCTSCHS